MIAGRYILQEELGRGAMGQVFKATDSVLQRAVAVKLLPSAADDHEGRQRLMIEAKAIAQLNHPNIVVVYDAGIDEDTPYLVMELLHGQTLSQHSVSSIEERILIAGKICEALEAAHSRGIIHRDLKPANVFVTDEARIKLMDFGLARMSNTTALTQESAVVGTLNYLAPEIIQGQSATPQSDLYALGIMLFELVAGKPPFEGENPTALLSQHLYAPVVRPSTFNEASPPLLDKLIFTLLEKVPEHRPASAREVLQSLAVILESQEDERSLTPERVDTPDQLVRGRLIGRDKEFQQAVSAWKKAASGSGQVLLVSGEPGIGKTRLIRELTAHVELSGAQILIGECYAGASAPYAPFAQILLQLMDVSKTETLFRNLPEKIQAEMITLSPSLSSRLPKIAPNPTLDPESEQQRMFESFYYLISELAYDLPLLLIIDDVHWSDQGTLQLILHLARRSKAARLPLLIVLTYREVEIAGSAALRSLLLDLNRERISNRLKLFRLDRFQVGNLLKVMFSEDITPEFLDGIYQETEGNPFFVEEVCKALIEDGKLSRHSGQWHRPEDMSDMEIPQSIRLAIETRLDRLPEPAQETLKLAAVIGREFDFDTLLNASDLSENLLIESLERAENADIIREIRSGRRGQASAGQIVFSFVHALIPSTLYDSNSVLRRRRLHRKVGTAIEIQDPTDYESLAYHFLSAGIVDKAFDYALKAANKAKLVHAYDSSISHLQSALALFEKDSNPIERLRLLEELGDIHQLIGEDKLAISAYKQALDNLRLFASVDQASALRLHSKIVFTAVQTVWLADLEDFQSELEESRRSGIRLMDQLPANEDSVRLLRSLSREAWRNRVLPDWDEVDKYARRAIEHAEIIKDPIQLSNSLHALGLSYMLRGMYAENLEVTSQRLKIVQSPEFDDSIERARVLNAHGRALENVGQYKAAVESYLKAENLSERNQDVSQQVLAIKYQSDVYYHLDQWDKVLANEDKWRSLQQSFPNFIERVGPICYLVALSACVRGRQGDLVSAKKLSAESQQIMIAVDGDIERWDRFNHH